MAYRLAPETKAAAAAVRSAPAPVAASEPPVIERGPFKTESPVLTVSKPPVIESVSSVPVVRLSTSISSPGWIVMVAAAAVSIATMSLAPGTDSGLQLAATSQEPLPGLAQLMVAVSGKSRSSPVAP